MAKLQREETHPGIIAGLIYKFNDCLQKVDFDAVEGTEIVAIDGDFQHTTNVNNARWLMSFTEKRAAVTRINADGSMTNLITEWGKPSAQYHIEDWKYEVANDYTRQSYAGWVQAQKEMEE